MFSYLNAGETDDDAADSLDAYMQSVGDHMDKTKRSELKHQLHELRKVSRERGVVILKPLPLFVVCVGGGEAEESGQRCEANASAWH